MTGRGWMGEVLRKSLLKQHLAQVYDIACSSLSERSKSFQLYMGIFSIPTYLIFSILIKTHGSESQGQEEAGLRDEPVSYLQVAPL